jgi:hypothetical protein
MGARIALTDLKVHNRFAAAGLEAALQSRPAAFFVPEGACLTHLFPHVCFH